MDKMTSVDRFEPVARAAPAEAARDSRGAHLVEYVLLVGLVAVVAIAGVHKLGKAVSDKATSQAEIVAQIPSEVGGLQPLFRRYPAIIPAPIAPAFRRYPQQFYPQKAQYHYYR